MLDFPLDFTSDSTSAQPQVQPVGTGHNTINWSAQAGRWSSGQLGNKLDDSDHREALAGSRVTAGKLRTYPADGEQHAAGKKLRAIAAELNAQGHTTWPAG